MLVCFDKSHILTLSSADPDASTLRFDLLRETLNTESVWLPALYFLVSLVNFLGFFFLVKSYPPRIKSGSIASVKSRFQIYIYDRKVETIA